MDGMSYSIDGEGSFSRTEMEESRTHELPEKGSSQPRGLPQIPFQKVNGRRGEKASLMTIRLGESKYDLLKAPHRTEPEM
jgi:hypothetical protein